MNANVTLNLLSLGPGRKVKWYKGYFINEHVFHLREYGQGRRHNSGVCVKGLTSNEFKVNYYEKLKDVIELQYHNEHNSLFIQMLLVWYH
jgi:hypothetical protein